MEERQKTMSIPQVVDAQAEQHRAWQVVDDTDSSRPLYPEKFCELVSRRLR